MLICFEKTIIAETFNNFYTTVACKLVKRLPNGLHRYGSSFVYSFYKSKHVFPQCFPFRQFLINLKYIDSINKATCLAGIPSRIVKDRFPIIVIPLTHIINLSQGIVPEDLKSARVVPLLKKQDNLSVGNYRPVSIFYNVSKNFERVVYDQVESYLRIRIYCMNFSLVLGMAFLRIPD